MTENNSKSNGDNRNDNTNKKDNEEFKAELTDKGSSAMGNVGAFAKTATTLRQQEQHRKSLNDGSIESVVPEMAELTMLPGRHQHGKEEQNLFTNFMGKMTDTIKHGISIIVGESQGVKEAAKRVPNTNKTEKF
ncbi:7096_t:CDS:2 [Ambispora leptoticha]|uniref:7096_t:CDS:1 n=1 Tax=Ambispora leptoticha TaxID=144679 RepID=A0A9N9FIW5_9GLOM|nr:7096_t:CDS:2 [Ambispora leptoticha]